ncbi:MAG: STAS domain-containing protein, partial [Mesorhizobium sp.]
MLTIRKRDASRTPAGDANHQPRIIVGEEGDVIGCAFSGVWTTRTVASVDAEMRKIENRNSAKKLMLDLSQIEKMDTAGAWLIDRLASAFEKKGVEVHVQGQSEIASILLGAVGDAVRREPESGPAGPPNIILRA